MSTFYDVLIVKRVHDVNGGFREDTLAEFAGAPAWEVAPALKQLAKKIHESPPPVVLDGQEAMPWS